MTALERLRLAAAIGHAVPAAELRLHTPAGETIVASAHPAADIDPCALRRVVCVFACPNQPDYSERVAAVEFAGPIEDLGGGVLRVAHGGFEQRWVASLLTPERLAELLDDVGLDRVPELAMHGCLKPDSELGVTLLVITANDDRYIDDLDEIAAQAAAAIFVEEMWCAVSHDVRRTASDSAPAHHRTGESA